MSTTSSNSGSYFPNSNGSKLSTPDTTPLSTPGLKPQDNGSLENPKLTSHALPALLREFPKPLEDIDIKAMLERQPGRWTIQGQIEANQRRAKPLKTPEMLREERTRDFEATKRDLLASRDNF